MSSSSTRTNGAQTALPGGLFFGTLLLGFAVHSQWPLWLPEGAWRVWSSIGGGVVLGAAALLFSALRTLRAAGTPIEPGRVPTRLVLAGPYRLSRNPMYLSLVMVELGAALLMGSAWMLGTAGALWVALDLLVVRAEEARLKQNLGDQYALLARRTRRWL